jgi:hypothetical protein
MHPERNRADRLSAMAKQIERLSARCETLSRENARLRALIDDPLVEYAFRLRGLTHPSSPAARHLAAIQRAQVVPEPSARPTRVSSPRTTPKRAPKRSDVSMTPRTYRAVAERVTDLGLSPVIV